MSVETIKVIKVDLSAYHILLAYIPTVFASLCTSSLHKDQS